MLMHSLRGLGSSLQRNGSGIGRNTTQLRSPDAVRAGLGMGLRELMRMRDAQVVRPVRSSECMQPVIADVRPAEVCKLPLEYKPRIGEKDDTHPEPKNGETCSSMTRHSIDRSLNRGRQPPRTREEDG